MEMNIYDTHEQVHYLQDQPDANCFICRDEDRMDAVTRRENAFEYEGVILKGLVV